MNTNKPEVKHLPPKSPNLGGLRICFPQIWGTRGAKLTLLNKSCKPLILVLFTAFFLSSCSNLPNIKISIEDNQSEEKTSVPTLSEEAKPESTPKPKAETQTESEVATTTEPQPTKEILQNSPNENEPKAITQSASGITPQQLNRRAKYFTVRIDGMQNGSGVIIDESDNTYSVLTNWHVVQEAGEYIIHTSDGRQHQINYQQVEQLPGVDLALVKFTSEQNYQIAEVGDSDYLSEGQAVHLAGYPGVKTNNDRLYRFYNLNIVGLLDNPINQGYSVLYEGETISGMSGSPLLNGEGNLVGIHGIYRVDDPTIRQGSSYAIPINTYKELASVNEEDEEPVAINSPQDVDNQKQIQKTPESTDVSEKDEKPVTNQISVGTKQGETDKTADISTDTNSEKINLLDEENGGKIIAASEDDWADVIRGESATVGYGDDDYAVYGFKDGSRAIFDTFKILVPETDGRNVKEFELFVGNDSPTGEFKSIGKFQARNIKIFDEPYQTFNFEPQVARYLKIKLLSTHGQIVLELQPIQLLGTLEETSAIPQPNTTESSTASNSSVQEELVEDLNATVNESEIIVPLSTDVLFDFDRADIREDAISTLKKLAQAISKLKLKMIQIAGHTDSKGSDEYNLQLSQQRAEAVASWLSSNTDIPRENLIAKGYGEAQPVADNQKPNGEDNPEGRAKNRRVEVIIPQ